MTMFIAFLFLLTVIAAGIAGGIFIFYGQGYEFRQIDADILNKKVKSCLSNNEVNLEDENEIFETCNLNKQSIEENFFIIIKTPEEDYQFGRSDEVSCDLAEKNKNFPVCATSTLDDFTIKTGGNQQAKRKLA